MTEVDRFGANCKITLCLAWVSKFRQDAFKLVTENSTTTVVFWEGSPPYQHAMHLRQMSSGNSLFAEGGHTGQMATAPLLEPDSGGGGVRTKPRSVHESSSRSSSYFDFGVWFYCSLLAAAVPVMIPALQFGFVFRLWDQYNKPVNRDHCINSCWDTVFKGERDAREIEESKLTNWNHLQPFSWIRDGGWIVQARILQCHLQHPRDLDVHRHGRHRHLRGH